MLPQRTLTALTLLTLAVAGCGAPPAASTGDPTWVSTPLPETTTPEPAPSEAPVTSSPTPSTKPAAKPTATPAATPKSPVAKVPAKRPASTYVFPVAASNVSWHKTHSQYPATDIFADCGKPFLAVTGGEILEISQKDTFVKGRPDGPANGGFFVSMLGDDGVRYYGSHLSKVQPGIRAGKRVTAGQRLGLVGRTGNANNVCHVHFGLSPKCTGSGDWKVRRGVVWPYSYLSSWRSKGAKSPASAVANWQKAKNCKA